MKILLTNITHHAAIHLSLSALCVTTLCMLNVIVHSKDHDKKIAHFRHKYMLMTSAAYFNPPVMFVSQEHQ